MSSIKYPKWLSDLIEKKYNNDQYKASDDPDYIAWAQEHAYQFADAYWCSCAGPSDRLSVDVINILKSKIIKSFKRDADRNQWQKRTNVIRPCNPTQCAYAWCCVRAKVDKPIGPTINDIYF